MILFYTGGSYHIWFILLTLTRPIPYFLLTSLSFLASQIFFCFLPETLHKASHCRTQDRPPLT